MLKNFRAIIEEFNNYRYFKKLCNKSNRIVFYSEAGYYWPHFEKIISSLVNDFSAEIIYLTSDKFDPIFSCPLKNFIPVYIGDGTIRTLLFASLKCDIIVMTMPDLQTYQIKRSPFTNKYIHIMHSIVSTHMTYREEAFDHFDAVFCVGPHHLHEIRAREAKYGLPPKKLIKHGYGRLETLIEQFKGYENLSKKNNKKKILVAPSWGKDALIESHGKMVIEPLLNAGYYVTLRPHPQTRRFNSDILNEIENVFSSNPCFKLEENVASKRSLIEADLMISDWSGVALEYAFSRLKPVLFIDVPRKVNNPNYKLLEIEPIEVAIRDKLGVVISESELGNITHFIDRLFDNHEYFREKIIACRNQYIYNSGSSGKVAAKAIIDMVEG